MKLYNITFNLNDTRSILIPSIPETAGEGENKTIKRVCFTDSVKNSIQALAHCNREVTKGVKFIVREIEVHDKESGVIGPKVLKNKGLVPDALENNEYWILKPVQCKVYKCILGKFDYDFTLAWTCISREQCLNIISKYTSIDKFRKYRKSETVYMAFCIWANKNREDDIFDAVWEDLAQLPWAQKTELTHLEYTKI